MSNNEVPCVPLAAFESQAERALHEKKLLIIGWAISMVMMCLVLIFAISYTEEVVEETETVTETHTLERVAEADNQGNAIVGDGDITIGNSESNGYSNSNDNEND